MIHHPAHPKTQDLFSQMIRVNHAGEMGAKRIYEGQLEALKGTPAEETIKHMYAQEMGHLEAFDTLMADHHIRPTFFSPLWHLGAYALGWVSGRLGAQTAMAVTIAVEEVIDDHYKSQEAYLESTGYHKDLKEKIHAFRLEELEHKDQALAAGGGQAPFYTLLHKGVQAVTKLAIALSKKI
jgi:ubiquinone biosynthesis monooxygenase Coq7